MYKYFPLFLMFFQNRSVENIVEPSSQYFILTAWMEAAAEAVFPMEGCCETRPRFVSKESGGGGVRAARRIRITTILTATMEGEIMTPACDPQIMKNINCTTYIQNMNYDGIRYNKIIHKKFAICFRVVFLHVWEMLDC